MILEKVTKEFPGLHLHLIPTKKFKTLTLFLQLKAPLEEAKVTKRALLSYVLKSGTQNYPTTKALRERLDDMYGASFNTFLSKKGDFHIMSLRMEIANERFIEGTDSLLEESLKFLAEVLNKPVVKENGFDEGIVKKEKRSLKTRLQSIQDDKMRYASQRLIDEMCSNERYHLHTYGYENEIDNITPQELYKYYQFMLENDQFDLYLVGDFNADQVTKAVSSQFDFGERKTSEYRYPKFESVSVDKAKVVKEAQKIEQGKLNLGFRSNIVLGDELYHASQVFNGLFGGFPHSKLFMNVREKASLAYYAVSRYESYKGLVLVMSGIEFENYDQAVNIIEEQLKNIQNGEITESEIEQTKALLKNSVLETLDNPNAIVDFLYNEVLSGINLDPETWLEGIDGVERDEIISVAQKTELDTIYFLTGQEDE